MTFIISSLPILKFSLAVGLPTNWSVVSMSMTSAFHRKYIHISEEICVFFLFDKSFSVHRLTLNSPEHALESVKIVTHNTCCFASHAMAHVAASISILKIRVAFCSLDYIRLTAWVSEWTNLKKKQGESWQFTRRSSSCAMLSDLSGLHPANGMSFRMNKEEKRGESWQFAIWSSSSRVILSGLSGYILFSKLWISLTALHFLCSSVNPSSIFCLCLQCTQPSGLSQPSPSRSPLLITWPKVMIVLS